MYYSALAIVFYSFTMFLIILGFGYNILRPIDSIMRISLAAKERTVFKDEIPKNGFMDFTLALIGLVSLGNHSLFLGKKEKKEAPSIPGEEKVV